MSVRLGVLLPGAAPVGVGATRPLRGFAWMADGKQQMVIAKRGSSKAIAAEIFCAALGRACELPVPEPVLIRESERDALMFGSVYQDYPNLMQRFRASPTDVQAEALIVKRLLQWSRITEVISFDEWINNVDRNLQNLLWDGYDEFFLIDHGLSLGLGSPADANKLAAGCVSHLAPDDGAIAQLKDRVLAAAGALDSSAISEAADALRGAPLPDVGENTSRFVRFVRERLPIIAALLERRFPTPQLGLEGV